MKQSPPATPAQPIPLTLRLCAAAIDAGLKKNYGPTHPQAGKFTPEFLASCWKHLTEAADRIEALEATLTKISAIRDSIVGMQGFNFSEHAYPLVAALNEAGFPGAGYEISRKNLGTLIEQIEMAESELAKSREHVALLRMKASEAAGMFEGLIFHFPDGDHRRDTMARVAESCRDALDETEPKT